MTLLLRNKFFFLVVSILVLTYSYAIGQVPDQIFPKNGFVCADSNLTFSWNPFSEKIYYEFEISTDSSFISNTLLYTNIPHSTFTHIFPTKGTYFWRVRYNTTNGFSSWSSGWKITYFKPTFLNSCRLWVSSTFIDTLSGSKIANWKDHSGFQNSLFQNNAAKQPLFIKEALGPNPALRFDNMDDGMRCSLSFPNGNFSLFIMYDYRNTLGYDRRAVQGVLHNYLIGPRQNIYYVYAGGFITGPPVIPYTPVIHTVIQSSQKIRNIVNGIQGGSGYPYDYPGQLAIGADGAFVEPLEGDMFEFIAFNDTLAGSDLTLTLSYLRDKFCPPVNLGEDMVYSLCKDEFDAGPGYVTYQWSTGQTSQKIKPTLPDTYIVTVTDIFNRASIDSVKYFRPGHLLNHSDTSFCTGPVFILATGFSDGYSFHWPDNSTADTLTVDETGTYWVKISDSLGCSLFSDTVHVVVDKFSTQVSLGNDTAFCAGNYIGLTRGGSLVTSFLWSGGFTDSTITVYNTGTYTVTASDAFGCQVIDSIYVTVSGSAPDLTFFTHNTCRNDTLEFFGVVVTTDSITDWRWTFGDGDSAFQQYCRHAFSQAGDYLITLDVVASSGCGNRLSRWVSIYELPEIQLLTDSTCRGVFTHFSKVEHLPPGDTITSWFWAFGDGSVSSQPEPDHVYSSPGVFQVKLTVITQNGCQSTFTDSIHVVDVSPLPSVFQSYTPVHGWITSDTVITFSWSVSSNAIHYLLRISSDSTFIQPSLITEYLLTDTVQTCHLSTGTYFWTVTAFNLCQQAQTTEISKVSIFRPDQIPGLKAWYAADHLKVQPGNTVSTWNDLSGYNNHAENNNSNQQPVLLGNRLNDKPTVKFDGVDDVFMTPLPTTALNFDIFIVSTLGKNNGPYYIGQTAADGYGLYRYDTLAYWGMFGAIANLKFGSYLRHGFQINEFFHDLTSVKFALNNQSSGPSYSMTPHPPTLNAFLGGVNPSLSFNGEIAELLFFDQALSQSNKNLIYKYLHDKYAPPPVELGPSRKSVYALCPAFFRVDSSFTRCQWSNGDTTFQTQIAKNGWLEVTVTDFFETVSSDSVFVQYPDNQLHDTLICLGDTIRLNASPGKGYSYRWSTFGQDSLSGDSSLRVMKEDVYWVTIRDTIGCYRTDTVVVMVDSFADQVSLGGDTALLCQGDYLALADGAGATQYLWSTGSDDPSILIQSAGYYSVIVKNSLGCQARDTVYVSLHGLVPVAAFFVQDSVCLGDPMFFIDLSHPAPLDTAATIVTWYWNFGDLLSSGDQNPVHFYGSSGDHPVNLTVTTDSGCVASQGREVYVYPLPQSRFLTSRGCTGVAVPFSDHSYYPVDKGVAWEWEFGDTASGNLNFSHDSVAYHIYNTAGNYLVRLIVTSGSGCRDTVTKTVEITEAPAVDFSYTPACEGNPVQFSDLTPVLPWTPILSWDWDFGDDSLHSPQPFPEHVYGGPGNYSVTLTIRTLQCIVPKAKMITVDATPVVAFNASDLCQLVEYQLYDMSTVSSGVIQQWNWSIDSLGNFSNPSFLIRFADPGEYNISLHVASDKGCPSDTLIQRIQVFTQPTASFVYQTLSTQQGYEVSFTNTSSPEVVIWSWDFGDGSFSSLENPVHLYPDSGVYHPVLHVITPNGCTDSAQTSLVLLYPGFDISVSSVYADLKEDQYQFSADLVNQGTMPIDQLDLVVSLNGNWTYTENWKGLIGVDSSLHYNFHATSGLSGDHIPDYYCIEARLTDGARDIDLRNNKLCQSINEGFIIREPYPNPVRDILNLVVILPQSSDLVIHIYNSIGQDVLFFDLIQGKKGLNQLVIPVSYLGPGFYSLQLIIQGKAVMKRFSRQ
ncbi:MAG: PKD domain-containing protein [Bacteroidetes bacterium]|nr:PKD domain-containing protein [Bacteroidota bacterium]